MDWKIILYSTVIASIISSMVSIIINFINNRANRKTQLKVKELEFNYNNQLINKPNIYNSNKERYGKLIELKQKIYKLGYISQFDMNDAINNRDQELATKIVKDFVKEMIEKIKYYRQYEDYFDVKNKVEINIYLEQAVRAIEQISQIEHRNLDDAILPLAKFSDELNEMLEKEIDSLNDILIH